MHFTTNTDLGKVRTALLNAGVPKEDCKVWMYNDKRKSGRRIKMQWMPDVMMRSLIVQFEFGQQIQRLFGDRLISCTVIERSGYNNGIAIQLNS